MQHFEDNLNRRHKCASSRQLVVMVTAVATLGTSLESCAKMNSSSSGESIVIEREVLVPGFGGRPNRMARLANGGLVIVGSWGTAWAAGTDANGKLLWTYKEPPDPEVQSFDQSEFRAVVALKSGGALICGKLSSKQHKAGVGLIVILGGDGHVVEHRKVFPNNDVNTNSSEINDCIPWGEGFALMGGGTDGYRGFVWLSSLDKNGTKVWERINRNLPGFGAVALSDNSLLATANSVRGDGIAIVRLNHSGEEMARRETSFYDVSPVRSVGPNNVIRLIAAEVGSDNVLLALDTKLEHTSARKKVGQPGIRDGCAYGLADGSVVLFGNGAGPVYKSAIGWVNRRSKDDVYLEMSVPVRTDASFSMRDAIPISPNRFVAMRDQVTANPETTGVVLSWVSFK